MDTLLELKPLNIVALFSLVLSKFLGILGVALGFLGDNSRFYGSIILGIAVLLIVISITCAIVQMILDRKYLNQENEDNLKIKTMQRKYDTLKEQIAALELKQQSLEKMKIKYL